MPAPGRRRGLQGRAARYSIMVAASRAWVAHLHFSAWVWCYSSRTTVEDEATQHVTLIESRATCGGRATGSGRRNGRSKDKGS